ncbi:MAG: DUF362 domain-containing protein [bacterium]|nr:DUF362 domain-containing protein [bacterium]
MEQKKINRKKFLKLSGIVTGALALSGFFRLIKDDIFALNNSPSNTSKRTGDKTPVYISAALGESNHYMEQAVQEAALAATDFKWLSPGQTVFIKPVLNSGNPYPATTSPAAISAMILLLKKKGAAKVIVGEMSGIEHLKFFKEKTSGSTRELMRDSGMLKAVTDAGGEPYFFEEAGWDSFYEDKPDVPGFWKKSLMMPGILKEIDHIVLMPRCSRHALAGSSLGLKAVVGYWRTDTRLDYHFNADFLHERTAEGNRVSTLLKKQRLVVSTGDRILSTFGPDEGFVFTPEVGLVIASESVVAHDMVSLAWLLYNRKLLPEDKQNKFLDHSTAVAKLGNTVVVKMLGTWGKAFSSETLLKNDLNSIWDDRVLNHAYKIFGGIPDITLVNVRNGVPAKIISQLNSMTHHS